MTHQNLLVELFVEELPPKALKKLGESFANVLFEQLRDAGLTGAQAVVTPYASPRRLAAHVTQVAAQAKDKAVQQKLMPVTVGLDASGNATPALLKKLQAIGADVSNPAALVASLKRAPDGKAEALFYDSVAKGATPNFGSFVGPQVLEGTYTVRLTKGKVAGVKDVSAKPRKKPGPKPGSKRISKAGVDDKFPKAEAK
jgi:glycyl-tRNA synthetase beta chain